MLYIPIPLFANPAGSKCCHAAPCLHERDDLSCRLPLIHVHQMRIHLHSWAEDCTRAELISSAGPASLHATPYGTGRLALIQGPGAACWVQASAAALEAQRTRVHTLQAELADTRARADRASDTILSVHPLITSLAVQSSLTTSERQQLCLDVARKLGIPLPHNFPALTKTLTAQPSMLLPRTLTGQPSTMTQLLSHGSLMPWVHSTATTPRGLPGTTPHRAVPATPRPGLPHRLTHAAEVEGASARGTQSQPDSPARSPASAAAAALGSARAAAAHGHAASSKAQEAKSASLPASPKPSAVGAPVLHGLTALLCGCNHGPLYTNRAGGG